MAKETVKKKRYMGLDYGSRTVGVALSDRLGLTAQALEIVRRKEENKLRRTLARLESIIEENKIEGIVLGNPCNMDGSDSLRMRLTEEFRDKLERRTGIPVIMWDERLTSIEAEDIMKGMGVPRDEFREHIDAVAAQVILQDFLDAGGDIPAKKG